MGKVIDLKELVKVRERLGSEKKKVAFTNGCFDLLHRGHVEFLNKAKACGDVLIVGLNSDNSTRRIKGDNRPIIPQEDRAFLLANLSAVDYVCIFEQDSPLHLISVLVPDVLVKGADWALDQIVGKDIVEGAGGSVMTIELVPNCSTTDVVQSILKKFS